MIVELIKDDLVNLVLGVNPSYEKMSECEHLGSYNGSYGTWSWNDSKLGRMSEQELWDFYNWLEEE